MEQETEYSMGRGNNISGYDKLVEKPYVVELRGKDVHPLHIGMMVELVGDSKGHVRGGLFKQGDKVVIVGFPSPGKLHHPTDIVLVSNGEQIGWVMPANIKKDSIRYHSSIFEYE
jgi:hypothetical protein